jgi:GDSL-like lipase/acylhydrolase family protein
MTRVRVILATVLVSVAAACSDANAPTGLVAKSSVPQLNAYGRGVFQRYVALGTSVSMGWQSDGVYFATQETSWPAQLAQMGGRTITQPYIQAPGCRPPLVAPLASGKRLSGEGAAADPSTLTCADNVEGVVLPTQNLAINAAITKDALYTTPENVTDPANARLYSRVLGPNQTQVSAMMSMNPKLVSVEFGGNELLNSRSGIAIDGATIFPYAQWVPLYDQLLDSVQKTTNRALIVGLIRDLATFPAFRRGDELWADRFAFAVAFNVAVSPDCQGSQNLLFVPVRVPTAVANGVARARLGLGPFTLSCAAGGPTTQDFVLDPTEVAHVNAVMAQMNEHIRGEAERRGFAYTELEALYGRTDVKPPFSVVALMTTATPYGNLISLDGVHPSAEGARILAEAAFAALSNRYTGLFAASDIADDGELIP